MHPFIVLGEAQGAARGGAERALDGLGRGEAAGGGECECGGVGSVCGVC